MANVRDFRTRIRSVKSTQQITRAMYLVSAAKMRRSQERIVAARPYARKMLDVMSSLAARADAAAHPLLARRNEGRVVVIVLTADKGLCGAFNTNILNHARTFLDGLAGKKTQVDVVGKKGRDWFKRRAYTVRRVDVDIFKTLGPQHAITIGEAVVGPFVAEEIDAAYLVYNEFKSVIQQRVVVEPLLPIPLSIFESMQAGTGDGNRTPPEDYIYEPSAKAIFDRLLRRHVGTMIYRALLESAAAEQGARMTAMDNATRNARDMIDSLTLKMNKIRQASITKEILEVVSGAEALK
ncbi:MAG TPA: ATP synthase F1 subunit gamma [Candidatus Polarisedimenticolia bacterium]|nr:ATP synthase F1 subunit gamma [Candidatus Polarisedimenticolia bacterium]